MRILVIDNNIEPRCWGSSDITRFAAGAAGTHWSVRRGPQEDLPRSPAIFDRLIVSGSLTSVLEKAPWISKQEEFIRGWLDTGKPLLGICYGHQLIGRILGGESRVRRREPGEFGWSEIRLVGKSRLLEGLPERFHSFSSHYDEVVTAPAPMRLTAESEACPVQAMEMTDRPVFSVQFHPEKEPDEAEHTYREMKKAGRGNQFLRAGETSSVFDPLVGERVFSNFLGL